MVDYEGENWLKILFTFRGSVFPRLWVRVLLAAIIGGVAEAIHVFTQFHISPVAHGLIGVALGLLLVFRTNASYDRFWEGRRMVGRLGIGIRDLMRQIATYTDPEANAQDRSDLRRLSIAFYKLAVQHLREETDLDDLGEWLTDDERAALEEASHRSAIVGTWISRRLASMMRTIDAPADVSDRRLARMEANLKDLEVAVTGCARIRFTPVPFAYAQHIKVFLTLFCYTAPFAMVGGEDGMGMWTPVAAAMLAFALFGIDEIGVEIEDPFGDDPNDLPLEDIDEALQGVTDEMLHAVGTAPQSVLQPSERPPALEAAPVTVSAQPRLN